MSSDTHEHATDPAEASWSRLAVASVPAGVFFAPAGLALALVALCWIRYKGQTGSLWAWTTIVAASVVMYFDYLR